MCEKFDCGGKNLLLKVRTVLPRKCLQISHSGITEMQGLVTLSSKQQSGCTRMCLQERDVLFCFQLGFVLKQEQERLLSKLCSLEAVEGEDRDGSFSPASRRTGRR